MASQSVRVSKSDGPALTPPSAPAAARVRLRCPDEKVRTYTIPGDKIASQSTVLDFKREIATCYNRIVKRQNPNAQEIEMNDFYLSRAGFPWRDNLLLQDIDFKQGTEVEMVVRGRGGVFTEFRADWSPTELARNLNQAFANIDVVMNGMLQRLDALDADMTSVRNILGGDRLDHLDVALGNMTGIIDARCQGLDSRIDLLASDATAAARMMDDRLTNFEQRVNASTAEQIRLFGEALSAQDQRTQQVTSALGSEVHQLQAGLRSEERL